MKIIIEVDKLALERVRTILNIATNGISTGLIRIGPYVKREDYITALTDFIKQLE